jgi:hypothetical protein
MRSLLHYRCTLPFLLLAVCGVSGLPARVIEDVRFVALQTFGLPSPCAAGCTTKVVAVRFPVTASDFSFHGVQTSSGAHPFSCSVGTGVFSGLNAAGA